MMRRVYTTLLYTASVAALVLGLLVLDTKAVGANGAPINVILTYLQGVSNWGPTSATGLAEIVMKEGEVNLSIVGLPPLSDETYVGWIVNTRNNDSMSIGTFNSDESEVLKLQVVLPSEIPDKGWNLFLVTVEPKGQEQPSPGDQRSIGGYFPDSITGKPLPSQLPKTGGEVDQSSSRTSPPSPVVAAPAPRDTANTGGTSILTYGIVALAAIGLGVLTRVRMRR